MRGDSNRKCGVIIFDTTQEHVLLLQEKYTNDRLKEWVKWDDWNADRLVERMNTVGVEDILNMDMSWKQEWIEYVGKLTSEKVKGWLLQNRELPDIVLRGLGKWGIVKGHVRYGESYMKGMRREIREEIGISMDVKYAFYQKGMKRSIYVGNIEKDVEFILGHEIDDVKWVSVKQLTEIKDDMNYNCTVNLPIYFLSKLQ